MNYLDCKQLEKKTLSSGNINAICYLFSNNIIGERINSAKYTHSDLNAAEKKELFRLNNLNEDDVLIGGEIHRVVGDIETKRIVLKKVDEIDLFLVMDQIQWIKNKR